MMPNDLNPLFSLILMQGPMCNILYLLWQIQKEIYIFLQGIFTYLGLSSQYVAWMVLIRQAAHETCIRAAFPEVVHIGPTGWRIAALIQLPN